MHVPSRTLTHAEARRVYDRIGARQDTQAFYEDRAIEHLLARSAFAEASRVFELGFGTGRLAERLLSSELPPSAEYRGVDVSPVMLALARERLARFGDRVTLDLSSGAPPRDEPSESCDRWLSTYVFDLLSEADVRDVLGEAHRMLVPGGRLCLVGLAKGNTRFTRAVAGAWSALHRLRPQWVGGCRPMELSAHLPSPPWRLLHYGVVAAYGLPSEVLVAERS